MLQLTAYTTCLGIFVRILMPIKPQLKYGLHIDNSLLRVTATEEQINQVYSFCHQFHSHENNFEALCNRIAPSAALAPLQLITTSHQLQEVVAQIRKEGYFVFDSISDQENSYKGFMTIAMLAFNNKGYLVDLLALSQHTSQLSELWEDKTIVKFCSRFIQNMENVKRDWEVFGVNFFDIELLEKSIGVKKQQSRYLTRSAERPILAYLTDQLQQRYDGIVKIIAQLRYFLQNQHETQQYSIYAYSNHYEQLLKEWSHRVSTLAEQQKQHYLMQSEYKRLRSEDKQNIQRGNISGWEQEELSVENGRDKLMCELIMDWREHVAKMVDEPSWKVIGYPQIVKIAVERPASLMEVQDILGHTSNSLDLASKILELLALQNQMNQNSINQLQMRSVRRPSKQVQNIRTLLADLKWQGRQQWLNRKNDESIKLYKQIVSIVELDGSVVEQFTELANEGAVGRQMGRYVKYAECFRNANHRKLKELYEQAIPLEQGADKDEDFCWQSDEEQNCFITGHSISRSQTSLSQLTQKLKDNSSSRTLATHNTSTHKILSQLDLNTLKIDPLPETIKQIYLKAATAKKGYQKVQKKKGSKRENKQEDEFVPSWQEINLLLSM